MSLKKFTCAYDYFNHVQKGGGKDDDDSTMIIILFMFMIMGVAYYFLIYKKDTSSDSSSTPPNSSSTLPEPAPTITQPSKPPEVFAVSTYNYNFSDAATKCLSYNNSVVATTAQLTLAQQKGADWCSSGWVSDSNNAMYPSTTNLVTGCGNGSPGIKQWLSIPSKAGINCYGVKPPEGTSGILPFNQSRWNSP